MRKRVTGTVAITIKCGKSEVKNLETDNEEKKVMATNASKKPKLEPTNDIKQEGKNGGATNVVVKTKSEEENVVVKTKDEEQDNFDDLVEKAENKRKQDEIGLLVMARRLQSDLDRERSMVEELLNERKKKEEARGPEWWIWEGLDCRDKCQRELARQKFTRWFNEVGPHKVDLFKDMPKAFEFDEIMKFHEVIEAAKKMNGKV